MAPQICEAQNHSLRILDDRAATVPLNYMYSHPGNLSPVSNSAWSQLENLDTAATFVGGRCFHRDSSWSLWAEA